MKVCNECGEPHYAKGKCRYHYKMPSQLNPKPIERNRPPQANKKCKPIPNISQKQLGRLKAYRKVRDEYMSQHLLCEAKIEGICTGQATDCHHKAGKIGDKLTDPENLLALCRACHSRIETEPAFAKEHGFSLNRLNK